jgi:hypothetical protein
MIPTSDPISTSGNLCMNHVMTMFNFYITQLRMGLESDIGRRFGRVIYYTSKEFASNIALRRELNDFIAGQEEAGNINLEIGANRVLILLRVDEVLNLGEENEQPDYRASYIKHYTVLNLKKEDDGLISIRYSNSLGNPSNKDKIPLAILKILREHKLKPKICQKEFKSAKQGTTANCGYYAVYHALKMLEIKNNHTIEEFIDIQRPLLQQKFGTEKMLEEPDFSAGDEKTDPLLRQIGSYYHGILTKLELINEYSLGKVLEKISVAASTLEEDEQILRLEESTKNIVEKELQNILAFKMAVALLKIHDYFDQNDLSTFTLEYLKNYSEKEICNIIKVLKDLKSLLEKLPPAYRQQKIEKISKIFNGIFGNDEFGNNGEKLIKSFEQLKDSPNHENSIRLKKVVRKNGGIKNLLRKVSRTFRKDSILNVFNPLKLYKSYYLHHKDYYYSYSHENGLLLEYNKIFKPLKEFLTNVDTIINSDQNLLNSLSINERMIWRNYINYIDTNR